MNHIAPNSYLQHPSPNVYQTPSVLCTSHVLVRSVGTRVSWSSAGSAPSVGSTTTEQCACVPSLWRATPTPHVSSVSIDIEATEARDDNGHVLAGCKSDLECPLTDKCVNRNCVLACSLTQCGVSALCESRDHRARCYCPPKYRGDPYVACTRPECTVDEECPQVLACQAERCVDPCDCAANAQCIVRSHRARCQCLQGYTGDPYRAGCYPSRRHLVFSV